MERTRLDREVDVMKVVHAKERDLDEFVSAYIVAANQAQWIGFSRLTGSCSSQWLHSESRAKFARHLKTFNFWNSKCIHHALGMLNGDLAELPLLANEKFFSCDSSAPVWRGMNGYKIDDPTWPNYAFEPLAAPEASNWDLANSNLKQVEEACGAN